MAILGLIVATICEKDNGDRIVNGMEMLENENDPDTVVGMTTVGMLELSFAFCWLNLGLCWIGVLAFGTAALYVHVGVYGVYNP